MGAGVVVVDPAPAPSVGTVRGPDIALPIGVVRKALMRPASLMTNTMLPETIGGLLTRTLPLGTRAASSPVALSSQCTLPW